MKGAEPTFTAGETAAGVLLLHDLAGTPQTMRSLGDALAKSGVAVDVPLLPGHGTALDDLTNMTWDDWASAAQLALDELASRTGPVVVAGIGMGATLACYVGAQHPQLAGIIAINPRAMPVPEQAMATLQAMLMSGVDYVPPLAPDVSDRRAEVVAYPTVPVGTLLSMFEAVNAMADHWSQVKAPTLIVSSARDHRVAPANAGWLAERIAGSVERLELENSFHMATLDVEHEQLEAAAVDFVGRCVAD
jgi:carboxylesterase